MNLNLEMFIEDVKNSDVPDFEKWAEIFRAIETLKKEKDRYLENMVTKPKSNGFKKIEFNCCN